VHPMRSPNPLIRLTPSPAPQAAVTRTTRSIEEMVGRPVASPIIVPIVRMSEAESDL
jgi:hypothetical protein